MGVRYTEQQHMEQAESKLNRRMSPFGRIKRFSFTSANRVSNETCLKRNRKTINKYIKRIGQQVGVDLALDQHGFCYVPFKRFLIIIQVSEEQPQNVHFYTMVFDLEPSQGITKVHKSVAARQLKGNEIGKRGPGTVSLEGDEVNLSFSLPVSGLRFADMLECLEDFMQAALDVNKTIRSIR